MLAGWGGRVGFAVPIGAGAGRGSLSTPYQSVKIPPSTNRISMVQTATIFTSRFHSAVPAQRQPGDQ